MFERTTVEIGDATLKLLVGGRCGFADDDAEVEGRIERARMQ
jgi:hypothetical protein